MHVKFLPGITLAEVNALAREWNGDRNRVIAVSAPQQARPGHPDRNRAGGIVEIGERRGGGRLRGQRS